MAGQGQIVVQSSRPSGEIPSDSVIVPGHLAAETIHKASRQSGGALRSRNSLFLSLAALLTLVALALAGSIFSRRESTNADAIRLPLVLPEGVTFLDQEAPVISPNGRLLTFVATNSSGGVVPLGATARQPGCAKATGY
jgi:hypothetical protein